MSNQTIEIGSTVAFKGFTAAEGEELPDNGEHLVEGEMYEVVEVEEETDENELSYIVEIDNPDFNSKKKVSKTNPKTLRVDVFADEVELVLEEDEEDEEETLEVSDLKKGMTVTITDDEGDISGTVTKVLKTKVTLEEDESGDSVDISVKDIEAIRPYDLLEDEAEEEEPEEEEPEEEEPEEEEPEEEEPEEEEPEEEEPEEEPAPKPKAKAKAKPAAKKKAEAKPKAKAKGKATAKKETPAEQAEDFGDMIILGEGEEDEDILALVEEADNVLDLVEEIAEESANVDYKLGGILYHVRVSGTYKEVDAEYAGNKGFELYVEKELSVGYRKARYLMDIYTKFNKFGLDHTKIAEIGWTRAQVICQEMDEDNASELLELAETEDTVADLKDTVKESFSKKGADTREVIKKVTFKFRLVEESADVITQYLESAGQQLGEKDLNAVFSHIVQEWAQEHLDISTTARKTSTSAKKSTAKNKPAAQAKPAAKAKSAAKPAAKKPAARAKTRGK